MKKVYLLLLMVTCLMMHQISGQNVTVTATLGTLNANYTTLKGAFDAINAGTHKGDITIAINASTTEGATPATLNSGDADPTSYTSVYIYPTADGVSVSGNPASGFGVVQLNGADFVVIDGDNPNTPGTNRNLSIVNTAAAATTYTSCIRLATLPGTTTASTDNNFIFNVALVGNVTNGNAPGITANTSSSNNTFGIYCGGKGSATTPTAITSETADAAQSGTTISNLVIDNISVDQCARGVVFNGAATTVSASLSITNSVIGGAGTPGAFPYTTPASTVYAKGIWVAGTTGVYIFGNTIRNIFSYVNTVMAAIELSSNIGNGLLAVEQNTIAGVACNGTAGGTAVGILVSSASGQFDIRENSISNIQGAGALSLAGIRVTTSGGQAVISKNRISGLFNRNTGGYSALGIHLAPAATGSVIRNNFIWDLMNIGATSFTPAFGVAGIYMESGAGYRVYNNTVHLEGNSTAVSTNMISCLTVNTGVTDVDIRNNLLSNTVTGGSASDAHVCLYLAPAAASSLLYNLNNNAYFTGSTAGVSGIAYAGNTTYNAANLYTAANFVSGAVTPATNFRAYSYLAGNANNDLYSFASTAAAPFINAGTGDLHIVNASVTRLESGGVAALVSDDIDGNARGSYPDIGADEFAGVIADQTPPLISYTALQGTCTLGNRVLSVTITDPSGVPTAGAGLPVLYWRINAGAYTAATGVFAGGNTYNFTFGAGAVVGDVVSYYIVAQDGAVTPNIISAPALGAAGFTANPPAAATVPSAPESYAVQNNLPPGTYNVGAGQTYTTLTAAVNAYNTSCLSGPVVFQLMDALYSGSETFPVTIGNPAASAVNTLTIRPAAGVNAQIIGSVDGNAIIKFNGADYVTIDGSNNGTASQNLTIRNNSTTSNPVVIWMGSVSAANGATNNVVKNSVIIGGGNTQTYAGIFSGSGTTIGNNAEAANNNNQYQNNTIHTANRGISLHGVTAGDNTTLITQNKIGSTNAVEKLGFRGIFVFNQNNITISSNQVNGVSSAAGSNTDVTAGISVRGGITNGIIHNNVIFDCKNTNTGGWTVHGITLQSTSASSGLNVYNNFIYDIAGDGWASNPQDNGHGIGILSGGGYRIYYNSVNLTTNQNEANAISAAIFVDNRTTAGTTPVNLDIRNNIFSNQQTTNTRYAIYSSAPVSSFTTINYNDYYTTGTSLGYIASSARANLAAWQAATVQDVNSVSVDPVFVSATDLHLRSALPNSPLDGTATPIAGFTSDIDGDTRNVTTPDMGADEFTPAPCVSNTGGTISSSSSNICVSAIVTLTATGYATGNNIAYQWESSPDGVTFNPLAGATNPSAYTSSGPVSTSTYYRLRVTCAAGVPGYSNVLFMQVTNPQVTGTSPGAVCGLGQVALSATGSVGTTLYWYNSLTGGLPIATGANYTTPTISSTSTYYVEAVTGATIGSVGPVSPTAQGGTIGTQTTSWEVYFSVIQATTLVSVDVFPLTAGNSSTLNVYNSAGTILASIPYTTTVSGGATPQTIPINLALPVGTGYYLYAPGGLPTGGLSRNTSGASYPYTSSAISITGNGFLSSYYMCYYNFIFSSGCASNPRSPVVATVSAAPPFNIPTATPAAVCAGGNANLDATDSDYSTYTWTPAATVSNPNIANPVANPTATTTYTVVASNGACNASAQVTVTVNPTPTPLVISPTGPVAFCAGAPAQLLTITGGSGDFFNEKFEAFPISQFAVSDSRITAAQNTTYYAEGTSSVRITHEDNISDASPSAYQTTSDLNLSLYSNPVLTFQHICALENNTTSNYDFGYVEYSTNGGTSWTPFPTSSYTGSGTLKNGVVCFDNTSYADWDAQFTAAASTPGAGPATSLWKLETINLSTWQTSTQFRIRFRIKSDVNTIYYGWLLDNIRISGQASITWSPTTELFTNAAGTIPYTGTITPSVYTRPTASRTYTASAAFGSCSVNQNVVINVTSNPISLTIAAAPSTSICGGDTVDFTIPVQNIQGSPSPFYDWRKNGVTITGTATGGSSSGTLVTVASTASLYPGMRVVVTAGTGFFVANTRIVNILGPTQFTVSVVPTIALSGATISASATGSTITDMRIANLATGDVITCVLSVGGVTCVPVNPVTSNGVSFTVAATTPTSVNISASTGSTICAGASVTFTATPTNGGASPTYQWFLNSISLGAPSASNTYTTSTLNNGDVITCRMASDATNCPFPKAPYSNDITMTVNPSFPVSVSIAASPGVDICPATSVTFTATPTNGGGSPLYEWFINGISQGAPSGTNTFISNTLVNGDLITCELTSSIPSCAIGNPATSNTLTINVTTPAASVSISPNAAICAGDAVTYTATPTNGGTTPTYEWFVNGVSQGAPSATATLGPITPASGALIRVDMYTSLSCATPVPATTIISQTVHANPTAAISGDNLICGAIPVVLNSNAAAGSGSISSIQWRLGGSNIGGATNLTYLAPAVGNYDVIVTNTNGCSVTSGTFAVSNAATLMSGTYTIGAITALNASSVGTTVTVTSTANLVTGALLSVTSGTGTLAANTVITSIIDATTFTVNTAPTVALSGASLAGENCTNYPSFRRAITDLNTRSIGGNCIFNVTPGYVETLTSKLPVLGNATLNPASAGFTITFQKSGVGVNPRIIAYVGIATPGSAAPDGIFTIAGVDNITIDGIDLQDNNAANNATMEYGYGLFKLGAGDGVQNALIQNCTITLNRINNAAGGGPMVEGSVGILLINSTPTAATTALTPTNGGTVATNGTNSGNRFYANTIQNCNHGIALSGFAATVGVGPAPVAASFLGDLNNDIGGTAAGTGNTVLNFGGGGAGAAAGIRANNQWSLSIRYNNVNSNDGAGVNHTGTLRGIYAQAGTSANLTISNNNVSVKIAATAGTWTAIDNAIGSTPASNTVNINNNTVENCSFSGATSPQFLGISNTSSATNVNINGNIVSNISVNNATVPAGATLINNTGTGIVNASISNNNISSVTNAAASSTTRGISVGNAINGTISSNIVEGISYTTAGSTGNIVGIVSGGGGQNNTYTDNIIRNLSVPATGYIYGIHENGTAAGTTKVLQNNQVYNFSTTTGGAGGSTYIGIYAQLGNNYTITGNQIYALNSTGTTGGTLGTVSGIQTANGVGTGGSVFTLSKNYIYNLSTNSTGPVVNGILMAGGAAQTVTAANNFIADLRAPFANIVDAIRGISVTSITASSTYNVYYNTVYLNGSSAGVNFGTSGIYHIANGTATTASLNLRNNIIYNLSTPNGTGRTVAFRRNAAALNNYAATSNNNLFYAGTPGAANLIYFDGANADQTLAAYKTRVSTRDAASVSDLVTFVSATDLHLVADANCAANGAGAPITGFTDDYDTDSRDASTPDIGADEFTGSNPVSIAITNPSAICSGGGIDLTAPAVTAGSAGGTQFYYYTDAGGTAALASPNNVTTSGTYYIKYGKGSCYSAITPVVVTIIASGTWLGVDNNWNNTSNWCGGVPTSATNVTIPTSANYPVINTYGAANNINVTASGAGDYITVNAAGRLAVAGSITSPNQKIIANGTISFIGSANQIFRADLFKDSTIAILADSNSSVAGLTIDNAGGMLYISNEVNFGDRNNQKLNTSNLLTLRSTSSATARIADVTLNGTRTGNDVIGKVVIERFIPARRAWRLLSVPIKSTTTPTPTISNNWQESRRSYPLGSPDASPIAGYGTHISYGLNVGTFDQNNTNNSSIFYMTGTGWNGIPSNTSGTSIGANNGVITDQPAYMLFVRGDRTVNLGLGTSAGSTVTRLRTTGDIYVTPDRSNPLSLTGTGGIPNGPSFSYVFANPYPSAISFEKLYTDANNSGMPNIFYVWDANQTGSNSVGAWITVTRTGAGTYSTSPVSIPSLNSGVIQPGMGFCMVYPGASPSITLREEHKVSGSSISLFRPLTQQLRTSLIAKNADATQSVNDGTLILFGNQNNNAVDQEDALKMNNFAENLGIVLNNYLYAIEKRKSLNEQDTIFFRMSRMRTKDYQLSFDMNIADNAPGCTGYLEDLFMKNSVPLAMEGTTNYDFNVTANTPSADPNRFRIVFRKLIQFTAVHAAVLNSDISVDWRVGEEMYITRYEVERSVNGTNWEQIGTQLSSGNSGESRAYSLLDLNPAPGTYYYRIKCIGKNGAYLYSDQVEVTIRKATPKMYVFPNPVTNSIIGLQLNGLPAGVYETRLFDAAGKVVNYERVAHASGTATIQIRPKNTLVSGLYQLEVIGPDKQRTVLKVAVKTE